MDFEALLGRRGSRPVKTPTRLQMEAVECGAASLGIILAYHGRFVPLEELRTACGVSRDGSKASNLVKAARGYGLLAKGFKMELERLETLKPPYIVFWHFNHFLVVDGFSPKGVHLNDPAYGPRVVSREEFDEGFTGVVLTFEPAPEFKRGGHSPSLFPALRSRLAGSEQGVAYALAAGILLVVPTAALPVFTQVFVDQVLLKHMDDWLRPLLLGLGLVALLTALLRHFELVVLNRLRTKLSIAMSGRFLWHVLRLPVGFFSQRYAGEVAERVSKNDMVADEIAGRLAIAAIDVLLLGAYALLLFMYDVPLALMGLALAGTQLAALRWVLRKREDANLRLMIEVGKTVGAGVAGLQSIESLKAGGLESDFFARWAGYHARVMNTRQALGQQDQWLAVLPGLLTALAGAAVLGFGGLRVMDGHLSLGMLIALQGLMLSFLGPVDRLVALGAHLQSLKAALVSLDDVLAQPIDAETAEVDASGYEGPARLRGAVEMVDITFGYSRLEAPLVSAFSFRAEPGQRIALVGGSGSGKSTLAKLLAGLYAPWSGEIRFDDMPRAAIPRTVLTRSVGMVDQDLFFFAGTVRENLVLWDATVPDPELAAACRDAEIQDVVLALAGGYEGRLLEGAANLSGGQRQRLEIARALAADPSILILDEATSALDAETERLIDAHLRKRGCTCIIVAHRLSTIRDADEIIMLDQGRIVQRGRHETLMADEEGPYARLIKADGALVEAGS